MCIGLDCCLFALKGIKTFIVRRKTINYMLNKLGRKVEPLILTDELNKIKEECYCCGQRSLVTNVRM